MIDLGELMAERSAGQDGPSHGRLTEVRRRIAVRRRRRAVAGSAAAVALVGALAAYTVVPGGKPPQPSTFAAGSATPSASPPATQKPVPGRKIGPFAEYARGYRVVAFGSAPVSSRKAELTWTVRSTDVQFFSYCPGLPDRDVSLDAEIAVNGEPARLSMRCNAELHQDPNPAESPSRTPPGASIGDTVTVTYTITGAQGTAGTARERPVPTQGTIYFAVAEKVPFADYPVPSRPATLAPPTPDGMAGEPGTRVVHSDPADPNKPVTTTLVWHRGYEFTVVPQTPGVYQVAVNGVRVLSGEVHDYTGNGPSAGCQVRRKDKGFCVRELEAVRDGDTVTVTVTARYATGPWLAELRSQWQEPSAQG